MQKKFLNKNIKYKYKYRLITVVMAHPVKKVPSFCNVEEDYILSYSSSEGREIC